MKVTASEFRERFGTLSDRAVESPLTITENGKDRLVLMSVEEFRRLNRRDLQALAIEEIPQEVADLIAKTEVDPRHAHLDEELADWTP